MPRKFLERKYTCKAIAQSCGLLELCVWLTFGGIVGQKPVLTIAVQDIHVAVLTALKFFLCIAVVSIWLF